MKENEPILTIYKEASAAWRHYSQTTIELRKLAQQTLLAYAVGLGIVVTNLPKENFPHFLVGAGLILVVFAIVGGKLNRHHSFASRGIRDHTLIPIEEHLLISNSRLTGPARAHSDIRRQEESGGIRWAWDLPYFALAGVGIASMAVGTMIGIASSPKVPAGSRFFEVWGLLSYLVVFGIGFGVHWLVRGKVVKHPASEDQPATNSKKGVRP